MTKNMQKCQKRSESRTEDKWGRKAVLTGKAKIRNQHARSRSPRDIYVIIVIVIVILIVTVFIDGYDCLTDFIIIVIFLILSVIIVFIDCYYSQSSSLAGYLGSMSPWSQGKVALNQEELSQIYGIESCLSSMDYMTHNNQTPLIYLFKHMCGYDDKLLQTLEI